MASVGKTGVERVRALCGNGTSWLASDLLLRVRLDSYDWYPVEGEVPVPQAQWGTLWQDCADAWVKNQTLTTVVGRGPALRHIHFAEPLPLQG